MFLSGRAIRAVAQNMAAENKVMFASVCVGNINTRKTVGKALKAMSCVKRRRLVRARDWIHFERSCSEL